MPRRCVNSPRRGQALCGGLNEMKLARKGPGQLFLALTLGRVRIDGHTRYVKVCRVCGKDFVGSGKKAWACGGRCARVYSSSERRGVQECRVCGKCYVSESQRNMGCSVRCATWQRKHPDRPLPRACGQCARPLAPRKLGQQYCSSKCVRSVVEARRRGRIRNNPVELVVPIDIFERDNWACYLCGEAVDPRIRVGGQKPSLDHIVPIRSPEYPGHIASNLALAHLSCNCRKQGRSLAELSYEELTS